MFPLSATEPAANPSLLRDLIASEIQRHSPPEAQALASALRARYGKAVQAILFYGSCLRDGCDRDGLLDLYVLVDDYRSAYGERKLALLNRLLPPNVFYLELPLQERTLRAKYAIVSLAQFKRGVSAGCFQSYFWARFAQPCAALYLRDAAASRSVVEALTAAVRSFVARVVPLLPAVFDAATLWRRGLEETYRTELRAERSGAAQRLVAAAPDRYRRITQAALAELPFPLEQRDSGGRVEFAARLPARRRFLSRQAWRLRRAQGKLLNVLRLMKAVFTFSGGVDYVLWKIERHTGIRVEATPRLRRHPLLAGWAVAWRLYRQGAFR